MDITRVFIAILGTILRNLNKYERCDTAGVEAKQKKTCCVLDFQLPSLFNSRFEI